MTRPARRVLVVDDDHAIRGFLAEALLDEGFEVRATASGGKTACATPFRAPLAPEQRELLTIS